MKTKHAGGTPLVSYEVRDRIIAKYGYRAEDRDLFYKKWRGLVASAKNKNRECTITFAQYVRLAKKAGINAEQIGRTAGMYHMARKGDQGGYTCGNCRFRTCLQNQRERNTSNGGIRRVVKKLMGVPKDKFGEVKPARYAVMVSPDGERHKVLNLSHFAREQGLTPCLLSRVLSGHLNHHKHWTGHYIF